MFDIPFSYMFVSSAVGFHDSSYMGFLSTVHEKRSTSTVPARSVGRHLYFSDTTRSTRYPLALGAQLSGTGVQDKFAKLPEPYFDNYTDSCPFLISSVVFCPSGARMGGCTDPM